MTDEHFQKLRDKLEEINPTIGLETSCRLLVNRLERRALIPSTQQSPKT